MRIVLFLFMALLVVTVSAQHPQSADPQINNNPPVNTGNQINQPQGGLGNEDININDDVQVQQVISYNQVVEQAGTVQINTNINWGSSQLSASSVNRSSSTVTVTGHKHRSVHKKKHAVVFKKMFSKKFRAVNHYSGRHRFSMCHSF